MGTAQELEEKGFSILWELTAWDTTIPEALESMEILFKKADIDRWAAKYHLERR